MKLQLSHPAIGTFGFTVGNEEPVVLGRDTAEADLELPWDPRVSRRHGMLWLEDETCFYRDLGSRNGTFIGQERLEGALKIGPGVRLLVGDTVLEVAAPETSPWAEVTETDRASDPSEELERLRAAADAHAERRRVSAGSYDTRDLPQLGSTPRPDDAGASPSGANGPPSPEDAPRPEAPAAPPRAEPIAASEPVQPPPPPARAGTAAASDAGPASSERAKAIRSPASSASPTIRFTGPARIRIEGAGLQQLYRSDLALGRLFVPGSAPAPRGARVWIDLCLEDGLHELSAEVVHVGPGPGGVSGVGLAIANLPPALRQALEEGADETSLTTVEIEPPVELLALADGADAPRPSAPSAGPPGPLRAHAATELAQGFISLVAANRLYEAIECAPEATDTELDQRLALWNGRLADGATAPEMEGHLDPLARALAMVEAHLGTPQARLRYDFAHGHIHAERRRELAMRGEGPSLAVLQSSWRRAFPAKTERARRLVEAAQRADQSGRREEAEQLRTQARSLAPFAPLS